MHAIFIRHILQKIFSKNLSRAAFFHKKLVSFFFHLQEASIHFKIHMQFWRLAAAKEFFVHLAAEKIEFCYC